MRKIGILGVGQRLNKCYEQLICYLGREPDHLFDNSLDKIGKPFRGKTIESLDILKNNKLNNEIIDIYIAIRNHEDAYRQLDNIGVGSIYKLGIEKSEFSINKIYKLNNNIKQNKIINIDSLKGKWVFISGASRGLGYEVAKSLAEKKTNLVLHARSVENLKNIMVLCERNDVQVVPVNANFESNEEVLAVLNSLEEKNIAIDILINNAATSPSATLDRGGACIDTYINTYKTNFLAPAVLSIAIIEKMAKNKYGRIVNITTNSQDGLTSLHYTASKCCLDKLTIELAKTVEHTNVSVCGVDPGYLKTGMSNFAGSHNAETAMNGILLGIFLGRDVNGKFLNAQDYSNFNLENSIQKFYNDVF